MVLVSCSTRAATLTVSPIRVIRACRRRDSKRAAESLGSSLVLMPRHAGSCSDFGGIDDRHRSLPPVEGTQAPSMYRFVRL